MKLFNYTLFFFFLLTMFCFAQWYHQNSGTTTNLNAVHFANANNGWAVGDSGKILYTSNGGSTWQEQTSETLSSLNDLCFINDIVGYVIGNNGTILKTSNGGMLWTQLSSGTQTNLNGVCFISQDNIWAVGGYCYWPNDFSIILKTTDGGMNWTQQIFEDTTSLNEVYFTDINNGWAVGWKNYPNYEGIILRTTNGGTDWIHQTSGTDWPLNDVHFINQDVGWVVGGEIGPLPLAMVTHPNDDGPGIVLKTVDGGMTWVTQMDTLSESLFSVSFIDSIRGFAVGFYSATGGSGNLEGTIINTTDGGISWRNQFIEQLSWFNGVNFVDANSGWVVGGEGAILQTTNGGVSFVEEEQINEIPTDFLLSQNYPNPFNPSTKIKYSILRTSQVQIKVFDVLGNEVETLVNQEKPAGAYELTWNAENLPSGVYFYQLKAGSFVETKKMVLIK